MIREEAPVAGFDSAVQAHRLAASHLGGAIAGSIALPRHQTSAQSAPAIVKALGRGRFQRSRSSTQRNLSSMKRRGGGPSAIRSSAAFPIAYRASPRARAVAGGMVFIEPDLDRFSRVLRWYWSILIPVGLVAILIAWLIGRRIARAVGPLAEVTITLRRITDGSRLNGFWKRERFSRATPLITTSPTG